MQTQQITDRTLDHRPLGSTHRIRVMPGHCFTAWTLGVVLTMASTGWAQIEPIGPLTLVPGQPIFQVFPNLLPPRPDYKELQFTGTANVPPGATAGLQIDFDYLDAAGNIVLIGAPNSPVTVIGGTPAMIDSGILRLPFCPTEVSLHLTNLLDPAAGVPIELVGDFRHQCFPVPEPGTLGMMAAAMTTLWGLGRRLVRS